MCSAFAKFSALDNVYLVTMASTWTHVLDAAGVSRLCQEGEADGLLVIEETTNAFRVAIWNSDGSIAEKSGNGLRIAARYLDDVFGLPSNITLLTAGGPAEATIVNDRAVRVTLGAVRFPERGPITINVRNTTITGTIADVGNPHFVCLVECPTAQLAKTVGPHIESSPRFPNRTNVQFARVEARDRVTLEIWERGSGYTRSSGTSAAATVGVTCSNGLTERQVTVVMPGGELAVTLNDDFQATIEGPVVRLPDFIVRQNKIDDDHDRTKAADA